MAFEQPYLGDRVAHQSYVFENSGNPFLPHQTGSQDTPVVLMIFIDIT